MNRPTTSALDDSALDAAVETVKPDGTTRAIPLANFHVVPGDTPHVETALVRRRLPRAGKGDREESNRRSLRHPSLRHFERTSICSIGSVAGM